MPIFSTSPPAYQTSSVGSVATQIYSGTGVSAAAFPAGVTLTGLTIINSGTATAYIGAGSTVTTATGLPLPAGAQLTVNASVAQGSSSAFNLWAISAVAAVPIEASLATVDAVV